MGQRPHRPGRVRFAREATAQVLWIEAAGNSGGGRSRFHTSAQKAIVWALRNGPRQGRAVKPARMSLAQVIDTSHAPLSSARMPLRSDRQNPAFAHAAARARARPPGRSTTLNLADFEALSFNCYGSLSTGRRHRRGARPVGAAVRSRSRSGAAACGVFRGRGAGRGRAPRRALTSHPGAQLPPPRARGRRAGRRRGRGGAGELGPRLAGVRGLPRRARRLSASASS